MRQSIALFIAAGLVVGFAIVSAILEPEPVRTWITVGIAAAMAVGFVLFALNLRRNEREVPLQPVAPATALSTSPAPWPIEALAAELAAQLRGTPFVVLEGRNRIRVLVNEGDERFAQSMADAPPPLLVHWDLRASGSRLVVVHGVQNLQWAADGGRVLARRVGRTRPIAPWMISVVERQLASTVERIQPPHPWRFITADVLPAVASSASRAGWRLSTGAQRTLSDIVQPGWRLQR